jgi:DNA mismatch repair protein MutS
MDIDNTTFIDLSIFDHAEEFSLFSKLDLTRTTGGRNQLFQFFSNPFSNLKKIRETQQIITLILQNENSWPATVTNGTIMVMERFYETPLDSIPSGHDPVRAFSYKLFHGPDFSLTRYSIRHFADFVKGMLAVLHLIDTNESPPVLASLGERIKKLLEPEIIRSLAEKRAGENFSVPDVVFYGGYIRSRFKNAALELIEIFAKLDAWYSMSMATKQFKLAIPDFIESDQPFLDITALHHLLLPAPVSYDVHMQKTENFFFLTGANMAGKSTFIKAVGCALFLAHLGMGVPATALRLTLFDGIISNINVVDNLVKGESYFFNEVQRIRNTILKINDRRKWLVLIDELFKGTNVQDAMKCSSAVIKGLIRIDSSLFILSTHLYEIGEELKHYPNISFKYFETTVKDDQLEFSYQLKEGISNDRIGYLILKREKVVELLEKL